MTMRSGSVRAHRRGQKLVHCARPIDNAARRDLDTVAHQPSVPLRRPRPQDDAALYEAVRAHWREAVSRAGTVDNTVRLDLDANNTARRDPATVPVKPSGPPRRPGQHNDPSRHEAVRARRPGGEVRRRARPLDAAAQLRTGPIRRSVPLWRPAPPNVAPLLEAVTVGEANLWRLRVMRSAVAFGAVLLFVALVVLSGRPFGSDDHPAPQPSVPSASSDGSAATEQPAPDRQSGSSGAHPEGSSGGALPPAQGVQAFSGDTESHTQPTPPEQRRNHSPSWAQFLLNGVLVVLSLGLFAVSSTTLWWMLHAWRSPDALAATGFRRRSAGAPRSFSLLLPARHEQDVLGDTIDALARLDHPKYEVIVIIGHDDPETEFVAREAAAHYPRIVRVVMDYHLPKNKPKALNTALRKCRGDIVGVFDAEDEVHPGLLRLVEARFEESGADVVQAGVQLMNVQTSWWSVRNCPSTRRNGSFRSGATPCSPAPNCCGKRAAGIPTAWPRTARSVCDCPPGVRSSPSPMTRKW
jgi:Glycosyltransferase like family 2